MMFFLSALESFVLILVTFRANAGVAVFMAAWCVFALLLGFADRLHAFPPLSPIQSRVNKVGMLVFPALISAWIVAEAKGLINHVGTPNRIQHLLWSASMVSLLLPMFARWWANTHRIERVLMIVGVVMFLGTLIEMVEFHQFASQWADQPWKGMWAWRDTTLDTLMNLIGSFVVGVLVTGRVKVRAIRSEL